jgi:hypothetical protein
MEEALRQIKKACSYLSGRGKILRQIQRDSLVKKTRMRENSKINLGRKPCRENKEMRQPSIFRQLSLFR